ncbi:T9SS type A sorting domain-containing protein [uncultured Chryseobacterium sp.]|nr:T9SS type A sorting domain-containing protein [uncultured Chryseobacterium sp.]
MKKTLLALVLCAGLSNAQTLLSDNFNAYTVGNIGTSATGASAGQGGWYTTASSTDTGATNVSFQIANNDATHGKVVKITGSAAAAGSRSVYKSISTLWSTRTSGNNIVQVEFDIYTGAATTSKNATRVYIYDSGLTKILSGVSLAQDTKVIQGVGYYDATAGGGSVGNYGFYLGGTSTAPADLTLSASSWIRVGIAFDKTTGNVYWKGPGFNGYVAGAATGVDPSSIYLLASAGTSNAVSADHLFDNLTVTAVNAINLLGTNEVTEKNSDSFKIYPNPATDFITVEGKDKVIAAYAYDASSKRIELSVQNGKIDVSTLTAGVYVIGLKTKNSYVTKKLIKK